MKTLYLKRAGFILLVLVLIALPTLLFDLFVGTDALNNVGYVGLLTLINLLWIATLVFVLPPMINNKTW